MTAVKSLSPDVHLVPVQIDLGRIRAGDSIMVLNGVAVNVLARGAKARREERAVVIEAPSLATDEAAVLLAELGAPRAPTTLRKLRCVGGGPPWYKDGAAVRYRRDDLVAWVAAHLERKEG
jgi:hypothetical protein